MDVDKQVDTELKDAKYPRTEKAEQGAAEDAPLAPSSASADAASADESIASTLCEQVEADPKRQDDLGRESGFMGEHQWRWEVFLVQVLA